MYFASLKTEELHALSFDIVYLDPQNPDPSPPKRITNDRWRFIRFSETIPLNIPNLMKLASACDPRTSSLAIYHDSQDRLGAWGLIDQGNSYSDYINYESESGPERPGLFHASTAGIGHLVAYRQTKKIAELKVNTLITNILDVFADGPIHDALQPGVLNYLDAIKRIVPPEIYEDRSGWDESLKSKWMETLCRLILRVQKYHHGGALLISPDNSQNGLNIKYKLAYDRLRSAIENRAALEVQVTYASDRIWEYIESDDEGDMPIQLYLEESVNSNNLEDNRREIDSTIWFISLLTRVDGSVCLNQDLEVKGFGVEITVREAPKSILLALSRYANPKSRFRRVDYNHYGTRHRSMMRYCYKVPGSVGFVVSQDGAVRAITRVREHLVIWDNIKLQLPDFIKSRRLTPKRSKVSGRFI